MMNRPFPSPHARFVGQSTGRLGLLCFCYLLAPDLALYCMRFTERNLLRTGNRGCSRFRFRYTRTDRLRSGRPAWDRVYIHRISDNRCLGPFFTA